MILENDYKAVLPARLAGVLRKRLSDDAARQARSSEVKELRQEAKRSRATLARRMVQH
jgi:hypothetical protein